MNKFVIDNAAMSRSRTTATATTSAMAHWRQRARYYFFPLDDRKMRRQEDSTVELRYRFDWFGALSIVVVLANLVALTMYDTKDTEHAHSTRRILANLEYFFVAFFSFETIMQIVCLGARSVFTKAWNLLDFVIILLSLAAVILESLFPELSSMSGLRVVRVLRPVKAFGRIPEIREVMKSVMRSLRSLTDVGTLYLLFMVAMGCAGIALFAGQLERRCARNEYFLFDVMTPGRVEALVSAALEEAQSCAAASWSVAGNLSTTGIMSTGNRHANTNTSIISSDQFAALLGWFEQEALAFVAVRLLNELASVFPLSPQQPKFAQEGWMGTGNVSSNHAYMPSIANWYAAAHIDPRLVLALLSGEYSKASFVCGAVVDSALQRLALAATTIVRSLNESTLLPSNMSTIPRCCGNTAAPPTAGSSSGDNDAASSCAGAPEALIRNMTEQVAARVAQALEAQQNGTGDWTSLAGCDASSTCDDGTVDIFFGMSCPYGYTCTSVSNPSFGFAGCNHIGEALLMVLSEPFPPMLYAMNGATNKLTGTVYGGVLLVVGSLFIMNLAAALISIQFEKERVEAKERRQEARQWMLQARQRQRRQLLFGDDGNEDVEAALLRSTTTSEVVLAEASRWGALPAEGAVAATTIATNTPFAEPATMSRKYQRLILKAAAQQQRATGATHRRLRLYTALSSLPVVMGGGGGKNGSSHVFARCWKLFQQYRRKRSQRHKQVTSYLALELTNAAATTDHRNGGVAPGALNMTGTMSSATAAQQEDPDTATGGKRVTNEREGGVQIGVAVQSVASTTTEGLPRQQRERSLSNLSMSSHMSSSPFAHVPPKDGEPPAVAPAVVQPLPPTATDTPLVLRHAQQRPPVNITRLERWRFMFGRVVRTRVFSLLSTIAMGTMLVAMSTEYYGMPSAAQDAMDGLNALFTVVITLEMSMRFMAADPVMFFANGEQLTGVVTLAVSWADVASTRFNFPAVRALRLVVAVRLLRWYAPSLHQQLQVIVHSFKASLLLISVIALELLLFACLGMQLLGGRSCTTESDSRFLQVVEAGQLASDDNWLPWDYFFLPSTLDVPVSAGGLATFTDYADINMSSQWWWSNRTAFVNASLVIPSLTAANLPQDSVLCTPLRMNFNSFGYAMLSSFSILTSDGWNDLMFDAMTKYSSPGMHMFVALIFCLQYYFGVYILLNLFIGILTSKTEKLFQEAAGGTASSSQFSDTSSRDDVSSSKSGSDFDSEFDNDGTSTSSTPRNDAAMDEMDGGGAGETEMLTFSAIDATNNESVAGSGESLSLSMSVHSGRGDDVLAPRALQVIKEDPLKDQQSPPAETTPRHRFASVVAALIQANHPATAAPEGRGRRHSKRARTASSISAKNLLSIASKKGQQRGGGAYNFHSTMATDDVDHSTSATPTLATTSISSFCQGIVDHPLMSCVITATALICFISLSRQQVTLAPDSDVMGQLTIVDTVCSGIFIVEYLLRVCSVGVGFYGKTRLWNWWETALCGCNMADLVLTHAFGHPFNVPHVLRSFYLLRPLRILRKTSGIQTVLRSIVHALNPLKNVVAIALMVYVVAGIMGVQLFKGSMRSCTSSPRPIDTEAACLQAGYRWGNSGHNFDHLGQALLSLFVVASLQHWQPILFAVMDAVGPGVAPREDANPASALFVIAFAVIGGFFFISLFVSVIIRSYEQQNRLLRSRRRSLLLTEGQQEWLDGQQWALSNMPLWQFLVVPPKERWLLSPWNRMRLALIQVSLHPVMQRVVNTAVVTSMFCCAVQHTPRSDAFDAGLNIANSVVTVVYIAEAIIKLVAVYPELYFSVAWNRFDFFIALTSVADIAITRVFTSFSWYGGVLRAIQTARAARLLRMAAWHSRLATMITRFFNSLFRLVNAAAFLSLLILLFSLLAMRVFGAVRKDGDVINVYRNFDTFVDSVMSLFQILFDGDWSIVAAAAQTAGGSFEGGNCFIRIGSCGSPIIAYLMFISYFVMGRYVLLNIFIAVIVESFKEQIRGSDAPRHAGAITEHDIKVFVETWVSFDRDRRLYIATRDLLPMLQCLPAGHPFAPEKDSVRPPAYDAPLYQRRRFLVRQGFDMLMFLAPLGLKEQHGRVDFFDVLSELLHHVTKCDASGALMQQTRLQFEQQFRFRLQCRREPETLSTATGRLKQEVLLHYSASFIADVWKGFAILSRETKALSAPRKVSGRRWVRETGSLLLSSPIRWSSRADRHEAVAVSPAPAPPPQQLITHSDGQGHRLASLTTDSPDIMTTERQQLPVLPVRRLPLFVDAGPRSPRTTVVAEDSTTVIKVNAESEQGSGSMMRWVTCGPGPHHPNSPSLIMPSPSSVRFDTIWTAKRQQVSTKTGERGHPITETLDQLPLL